MNLREHHSEMAHRAAEQAVQALSDFLGPGPMHGSNHLLDWAANFVAAAQGQLLNGIWVVLTAFASIWGTVRATALATNWVSVHSRGCVGPRVLRSSGTLVQ